MKLQNNDLKIYLFNNIVMFDSTKVKDYSDTDEFYIGQRVIVGDSIEDIRNKYSKHFVAYLHNIKCSEKPYVVKFDEDKLFEYPYAYRLEQKDY